MNVERSGERSRLIDKFRGALVGAAVGDALGARFEGARLVDPAEIERLGSASGPFRYTDDTHMTLGVAESLVTNKGFDGAHMAELFARNFRREPWRGYGPGPPQVFRLLGRSVPWDEAGRSLFGGLGSFGNGAAMRVSPVALLAFPSLNRSASLARETSIITHAHEHGIEGAVLQACAVSMALQSDEHRGIDPDVFIEALRAHVLSPRYADKVRHLERLLTLGESADLRAVVADLGNGVEAFESVPSAIYAFLRSPDSFKTVVEYAIGLGGDTDTIGSMAGAIAGAYLGVESIPAQWRDQVEGSAELQALADSLLSLAVPFPRC